MKKAILLVPVLAWLVGCGTASGRLGPLPEVANRATASKVVVVRVSSVVGAANGYTVALDGKDLLGIGSGEHAEFLVPPGEHYLGVKCFGGFSPTWKEDSIKFAAPPSKPVYFVVSPSMSCAAVKAAEEQEVVKLLPSSKPVNLDKSISK